MNQLNTISAIIVRFKSLASDEWQKALLTVNCYKCVIIMVAGLVLLAGTSCNPEEWETVDCSECFPDKPGQAEINVRLTINATNPSVVIDVYSGRIEEGILILSDTSRNETWTTILPVDEYYTIAATYRAQTRNASNVTAIDGSHVRTKKVRAVCDEPCWVVRGNNFNVRLRY